MKYKKTLTGDKIIPLYKQIFKSIALKDIPEIVFYLMIIVTTFICYWLPTTILYEIRYFFTDTLNTKNMNLLDYDYDGEINKQRKYKTLYGEFSTGFLVGLALAVIVIIGGLIWLAIKLT